jgi:hypothetical protein
MCQVAVAHLSGASKRMFVEQKVQDEIKELQLQLTQRVLYLESLPKYDDGIVLASVVHQNLCGASVPGVYIWYFVL